MCLLCNLKATSLMPKSISLLFTLALFSTSGEGLAQSPEAPVEALFNAMRAHDGEQLAAQFTNSALLQRAEPGGNIKSNDLSQFAGFVNQTDKHLDEKLLAVTVQQSDNLAAIWTPYVFYLDGKLSHCGVNSFQLVRTGPDWKIHYLIDNVHGGDCEQFINQFSTDG